jgi:arylsulfatase A-like enzyme
MWPTRILRSLGLPMMAYCRLRREPFPSVSLQAPRPLDLFLFMVWAGLLTGVIELGLVLAQREFLDQISLESLRTNRHFVWMIPTADVFLFGVAGVFLAWLCRRRPEQSRLLAYILTIGGMALSLLWSVECLHSVAGVVIACAIVARAVWSSTSLSVRSLPIIRLSLPFAFGCLILLGFLAFQSVTSAEDRALSELPSPVSTRPNVLMIVMDNVRACSMSLYGHTRPTTPRLEELAQTGVRYDSARSTAPWTLPSHASMLTGQWPHRLSVDWDSGLDETHPTLAEFLGEQGYATAGFVGNTYYCNARYGLDRGFARYEDFLENEIVSLFEIVRSSSLGKGVLTLLGYSMRFAPGDVGSRKTAATINQKALDWLSQRPADRPFFLFLNYYDAHSPFIPPAEATQRFGLCALPRDEQIEILKRAHQLELSAAPPSDAERDGLQQQAIKVRKDGYESSIAYLDEQLGRLFQELRKQGLLENTLVIVTSDHGEHFEERGFSGHGVSLYRREIHVPLLIFPPAVHVQRVVSQPVSLCELPATIVEIVGLAAQSPFPGQSLSRFFQSGENIAESSPRPVLSEVAHRESIPPTPTVPCSLGTARAVTTESGVYIRNGDGSEEFYDHVNDPHETINRINEAAVPPSVDRFREMIEELLDLQNR